VETERLKTIQVTKWIQVASTLLKSEVYNGFPHYIWFLVNVENGVFPFYLEEATVEAGA
jgi:hypothetical protein